MLLGVLVACTCTPFADMDVVDATGEAGDDFLADISAAITDYASWTGRDGVCVPEVRVVHQVDAFVPSFAGMYQGQGRAILLSVDSGKPYIDIVHELSHGLDHLEHHSRDHPDLFPA